MRHLADINTKYNTLGSVLNLALVGENLAIVEMLLDHRANANATGSLYGSAMKTAARCLVGEQAIPLLLERGAEEIPIDPTSATRSKRCYGAVTMFVGRECGDWED